MGLLKKQFSSILTKLYDDYVNETVIVNVSMARRPLFFACVCDWKPFFRWQEKTQWLPLFGDNRLRLISTRHGVYQADVFYHLLIKTQTARSGYRNVGNLPKILRLHMNSSIIAHLSLVSRCLSLPLSVFLIFNVLNFSQ